MKFNMDKWSNDIIEAKDRCVLPVLYFPCLSPLTGMGVVETVKDGKKMAQNMKAIVDRFPTMIAAMTGMDLTVDSEAFGAEVTFKETEAPSVANALLKTVEDIDNLEVPDVHSGRVDVFLDACIEAQNLITDRPIFGGQLGPFSLAANLLEVQSALMMTLKKPAAMEMLLEKATEFLIKRAKAYKDAGANGIFLAEPTAGLLSPKQEQRFSSVYTKRIVDAVQDSSFYVILHNCGQVTKMVPSMYSTGAKGLHFGNIVDMKDILPQIPPDVLVFGNIDPTTQFYQASPSELKDASKKLLRDMDSYPHFVLSSGCDIPPMVSMENLDAFFNACAEYNH